MGHVRFEKRNIGYQAFLKDEWLGNILYRGKLNAWVFEPVCGVKLYDFILVEIGEWMEGLKDIKDVG